MFILIKTAKLLLFLAICLDYVGLMKKKKCGALSPCTFCIKVCGFEMLKIGKKIHFSIQKHIQNPGKHLTWDINSFTIFDRVVNTPLASLYKPFLSCNFHSKYYCFLLFTVNVSYEIHFKIDALFSMLFFSLLCLALAALLA